MLSIPTLAGRFPFRLGTTSFIVPADMETNVRLSASTVDDIELLFFESHEVSDLPTKETIRTLKAIARRTDLSFTIHLPLDCRLGHPDKNERDRSKDKCLRIMDLTAPLDPFAFVLHLRGDRDGPEPIDDVPNLQARLFDTLGGILARQTDPARVCIENLDYPFEQVTPIAEALGMSLCLDIGHILMGGCSMDDYLKLYLGRARVVHLHGVRQHRDHRAITFLPNGLLNHLFAMLVRDAAVERVVTLEVFNEADLIDSAGAMEALIQ
jgi:sugar phosphate isomerase/epimerase